MDHPCCSSWLSRSLTFARSRASGNFTAGGRLDQFQLSLPKFHGYSYHLLSLLRFASELLTMEVPLQRQKEGKDRKSCQKLWLILAVKLPIVHGSGARLAPFDSQFVILDLPRFEHSRRCTL